MKRQAYLSPFFGFTLLLLSGAMVQPTAGQTALADHPRVAEALHLLDVWMDAEQAYRGLPGMSAAVVHDQELVWAKGFGYAHVEQQAPATPSTMYSICSISKLFTAVSVMQLRDRGHLGLDDPAGKHLDWFQLESDFSDAGPVTVEGILTHSAGLPREAAFPYWTGPDYPFPTHDEIVEHIAEQSMLYPTRTYYQYSNLGLTLAGEIVSTLSGQSYDEYVKGHILAPLGMANTHTDHIDRFRGNQLATGYTIRGRDGTRQVVPPYQVRGIAPAAGFISTVEDLGRFASWQFRALDGHDDSVLDRNTLREMHRVHWLEPDGWSSYGLGFSVWKDDDKTFVGHGGSCPGYRSQLLLRPQKRVATVFMTNGQGVNARRYTQRTYDIVAPAIRAALEDLEVADEPAADVAGLDRFTGLYKRPLGGESVVLVWQGKLAVVGLPTEDPLASLTELQHMEGNVFRRIRDNDDLGEAFVFEEDAEGRMRLWRNYQYSVRER
jgi:CubicO group peptidase (beta-lactamase class C family)